MDGMLAESFEVKGNQAIFTLRQGLTYQDGTPITAQVIEQGYKRVFAAQGISYFLLSMAGLPDGHHVQAHPAPRPSLHEDPPDLLLIKRNTMHNPDAEDFTDVNDPVNAIDP